jgi:cytochrome P450
VKDGLDYFSRCRARYGDIYTLDLGATRLIALNHPRHVQHVLRDQAGNYRKGGPAWDALRALIGNGLPVSEGELWMRQRRMLQPQFHRERLATMYELMVRTIDEELEHWDVAAASGEPLDLAREFPRITLKVIVRTMFGAAIRHEEADSVGREMKYVLDYLIRGLMTQRIPAWVPVPGRRRFQRAGELFDQILFGLIERHRREGGSSGELFAMLLDMVDAETGQRMTNQQLRDEAVSIFISGYETTSTTLAWAVHVLLEQPELLRSLVRQSDTVLGERRPGFADLPRLSLASGIMQETLRLYPPTYFLPRTAVEDAELDGFRIPRGSMVGLMTYIIHRHPEFWEEPDRFDPERFSPERSVKRDPLAWLPFGAGQRMCIAKDFALMEGQLILTRAAQRYHFEAVPGRSTQVHLAMTLQTRNGVWARLTRRSRAASVAV